MTATTWKVSQRRPIFLYGVLLYPIFWAVLFISELMRQVTMNMMPWIDAVAVLTIEIGAAMVVLALLRREQPFWLTLASICVYAWLLFNALA
jgi:hypothetical protein